MRRIFLIMVIAFLLAVPAFCSLEVITDPQIAWQGKVLTVKIASAEGVADARGSFLGYRFPLYNVGDDYRGIVGVPIDQKPGHYNLKLIITYKNGRSDILTKRVKLWSTRFPFSKFWLKPSKDKLRSPKIVNNEWAQIEKVLVNHDPAQRWKGKFLPPVEATMSQGFGHRQIINNKRAGSHRGIDYAVLVGTNVRAPNDGKVVFIDRLMAFGGTLVLDHGQGIHTLYFHLSKIFPKVGDEVKKGDIIALSGDSGVSSGAHLHWGMSVHNLRVDPLQWVKYEI